jgi:hypothetical protein
MFVQPLSCHAHFLPFCPATVLPPHTPPSSLSPQEERALTLDEDDRDLLRAVLNLEITRVRYLLRSYHRTRIHKLEQHWNYILETPSEHALSQSLRPNACLPLAPVAHCTPVPHALSSCGPQTPTHPLIHPPIAGMIARLSAKEKGYLQEFARLCYSHMRALVGDKMPGALTSCILFSVGRLLWWGCSCSCMA